MIFGNEPKFKNALKNAKHYKAIGVTDVWLDDNDPALPWHLVTEVNIGNSYAGGIPTSYRFKVAHKETGLSFAWSFQLEKDGKQGPVTMDTMRFSEVDEVMKKLPAKVQQSWRAMLVAAAQEVMKRSKEMRAEANRYYGLSASLAVLGTP